MKTPTISLCMIVLNEEETLKRCLDSIHEHVDEIIIVDTGSTDNTLSIAKEYTPHIYQYKWQHHFGDARNYALDKATKDWVLQMDADEYFTRENAKKIRNEVQNAIHPAIGVRIINYLNDNQLGLSNVAVRLFSRKREHRYHFPIHEQILHNERPIRYENSGLKLYHTGYTTETIEKKKKHERNMNLLKEALKSSPHDVFMHYNIGKEYDAMGDFKNALFHFETAYHQCMKREDKLLHSSILFAMINTHYRTKNYEKALSLIAHTLKIYPDYTEIHYTKALCYHALGYTEKAKKAYEQCILLGDTSRYAMKQEGVGSVLPLEKIASLLINEGRLIEASEIYTGLLETNKTNLKYLTPLFQMMKKNHTTEEDYLRYLDFAFDKQHATKLSLCFHFKITQGVLHYYKKGIASFNDKEKNIISFYYHLYSNDAQASFEALKRMSKEDRNIQSIIYFLSFNDKNVASFTLGKTSQFILRALMKPSEFKKPNNYDLSIWKKLIQTLFDLNWTEHLDPLMTLLPYFDARATLCVAEILDRAHETELAVQFYSSYLTMNQSDERVRLRAAELLFQLEMYEEAILYASSPLQKQQKPFRALEIISQCHTKLGAATEAKKFEVMLHNIDNQSQK